MKAALVGANGKIGRLLVARLRAHPHLEPVALVRSREQADRFAAEGVEARVIDLEGEFAAGLRGTDAVVFTAGSGAHTGKDKTLLVDLWGAVRVMKHCQAHGPRRFVMVSSIRAGNPDESSGGIKPYVVAKWAADEYLQSSGLDFTILRPGRLLDAPATGLLQPTEHVVGRYGEISRDDVAAAIEHCLATPATSGRIYDLLAGEIPLKTALG